jgi:hypothetical protein
MEEYQKLEEDDEESVLRELREVVRGSLLAKVHLLLLAPVLSITGGILLAIPCILLSEDPTSDAFIAGFFRKSGRILTLLLLLFAAYPSGRDLVRYSLRLSRWWITARPFPDDEVRAMFKSSPGLFVHFWAIVILNTLSLFYVFVFLIVCTFYDSAVAARIFLLPGLAVAPAALILIPLLMLYPSGQRLAYTGGCRILAFLSWKSVITVIFLIVTFCLLLFFA